MEDLGSLPFDAGEGLVVPAAGAPWYMALFGRDALITGYQAMILGPEPARNALRALARHQARERDDFRDAEPGKILHELRHGELAYFGEIPQTPYYGTVDATPLFLILLSEVWRWSGDEEFVGELEGAARRALDWILHHADRMSGYVAYATRSTAGLQNHGWRDPRDSMLFRDGTRAEAPIAPCEVQGYVYDAFLRTAELAERVWGDARLATSSGGGGGSPGALRSGLLDGGPRLLRPGPGWRGPAGWTPSGSSAGHLLWSGIVPEEKARAVADLGSWTSGCSGVGRQDDGCGRGGIRPGVLPQRLRLAPRQRAYRAGPPALRLSGGGEPISSRRSSTPPRASTTVCPRSSRATRGARSPSRSSCRGRAARRRGLRDGAAPRARDARRGPGGVHREDRVVAGTARGHRHHTQKRES